MVISLTFRGEQYKADLSRPLDISIPLIPESEVPKCFWAPNFDAQPVKAGDWIGDTLQGGSVNFKNVTINPHGNGTHTECVGHIAKEAITINRVLSDFHHMAQVISILPNMLENGDRVIVREHLEDFIEKDVTALIIRTLPNHDDKLRRNYSGTNPPYMDHEAISYIVEQGIQHLLIDLPSVDREEDGGKLLGHKAFWGYPETIDTSKTISELIFVNNLIIDGIYLLNLQISSFELDVSPSKPVLYKIDKE